MRYLQHHTTALARLNAVASNALARRDEAMLRTLRVALPIIVDPVTDIEAARLDARLDAGIRWCGGRRHD